MLDDLPLDEVAWEGEPTPNPGDDHGDVSGLIGAIYDAALEPERWPQILAECARFVGGRGGSIFAKSISGIGGGVLYTDQSIAPVDIESYFELYAPMDPSNPVHLFAPVDEVIQTASRLTDADYQTSRFWREWLAPQGLVDMVLAPIHKSGTHATLFGVFRYEEHGFADQRASDRLGLLTPHVRRAYQIGTALTRARLEAASFGDLLDGLSVAVFLVDAAGRVVHANRAGHSMLGDGKAVMARHGGIISLGRAAGGELAQALAEAGRIESSAEARSIGVTGSDGERYVAHILPLNQGERRRAGAPYDAVAALFVQRAGPELASAPETVARTFALTPAELRVLTAIVEVGGVPEVAETLGIAESTVKTHLHRVFGKTETTRQADLVRLLAAYRSPLAR